MQALGVVDLFNEPWQAINDIAERLVAADPQECDELSPWLRTNRGLQHRSLNL